MLIFLRATSLLCERVGHVGALELGVDVGFLHGTVGRPRHHLDAPLSILRHNGSGTGGESKELIG
jgi:hypothetical protein